LPTVSHAPGAGAEPDADVPAVAGYEILSRLAPGGMGMVYRARQVALNRTVALKVIRAGTHAGPQERARFRVEAEAVASLSHPHIIPVYEYGEWNDRPYLAMEFAEGGSLAGRLAGRPLPPPQAAELVETLARAVQFVHERGLLHRDLKPANVLLQRTEGRSKRSEVGGQKAEVGSQRPEEPAPAVLPCSPDLRPLPSDLCSLSSDLCPKLADFGLAKRLDQDQGLTGTQAVLGTASYMAPEQAAGDRQALGPAADVYGLGAILYEVLTGQPPFLAPTPALTLHQVLSEEPPPPTRLRPDVPAELEAICLKCLEKEPGRRFASALALAEDLRRFRDGEPTSTRPLGTYEWHTRSARRAGYEILDTLGASARGVVYKARHLALNRTVALHMIAVQAPLDPARLARLRAEAEAVAQLHHPNIVEVYDFGEHNGEPYLATEYVEGIRLADAWAGPGRPAEQTAALVETLARAAHHAHQRGLVHGDLRPARILLAPDGTCKITGFGLSGGAAAAQGEALAEPPSPSTDVYALGAILHELLSGRPPTAAATSGAPESPRHWRPEVPRGLEAICLHCLEPEPARRYPSAAALAEDLRRFRSGDVLFVDDLDDGAQQERWARRAGYEIVELLGRGRDGFSYLARQVELDRVVVLKRLTARDRFVPAAKARFRREAYLLAGLRHANIVQVYDQGEQNDLPYFAREFVDGPSLAERAAEGPLPCRSAAELVETLAQALQAAHARGAVHGGLNPAEVRLTPAGLPKFTSFRRARLPGSDADAGRPASELCHRAGYLAPEQLDEGRRRLVPATDVYGLGAILYTLLTGGPVFAGPTLPETLAQVRSEGPVPPRHRQPAVPPELDALCLRCLDKQPGRRPASAAAVADELRRFLAQP
jgi:serine/threonine protein kinase